MKLLPCHTPGCDPGGHGALWGRSTAYPKGEPAVSGQYVQRYKCARCGRVTVLTNVQYNALPELTLEDFQALAQTLNAPALADLPTKDWTSVGLKKEHAEDLFRVGLHDPNHPDVAGRTEEA